MDNEEKNKRIKMIYDNIIYWTNFGNNNPNCTSIDVYDIIDNLSREKYDIIHGTHTLQIKKLSRRIKELESNLKDISIFKRGKYKREIADIKKELSAIVMEDAKLYTYVVTLSKETMEKIKQSELNYKKK